MKAEHNERKKKQEKFHYNRKYWANLLEQVNRANGHSTDVPSNVINTDHGIMQMCQEGGERHDVSYQSTSRSIATCILTLLLRNLTPPTHPPTGTVSATGVHVSPI